MAGKRLIIKSREKVSLSYGTELKIDGNPGLDKLSE